MTVNDVKKGNLQTVYADPNVNNKASAGPKLGIGQTQQVGEIAKGNYSTSQPTVSNAPATSNAMTGGTSSSNAMAGNTGNTASNNVMTEAAKPYVPDNGMMGIRDSLVSRGVNTNRIGWNANTGMVTIDGKDAFKPSNVVDGVSYANKDDINNLTDTAYRNSGDPVSGATSYVASQGLGNAVTWSDGNLMIGGTQVPVMYVDDNGKAYALKSDLDRAISIYKNNSGITGNQEVVNNWENKYGDRIQDALDAVINREKWSYNPEDDPAYQAYADAYTREGNRAYQNAYAQMAANTGGYGSSAGMTAAGQQMNYYMQQLGDRVPELMQNSYNRYLGEQELNRSALESLRSVAQDDYNREYQANRDSINDATTAGYYDYLRDTDARDYNAQEREWPYQEAMLKQQVESGDIANKMSNMQYVLSKYSYSGNLDTQISPEDASAMGISAKADGSYPTIREIQETYARLQAYMQLINWNEYGKHEMIDTKNINAMY